MSYRPKGKHVMIDPENPEALGICDYTGFVFNRKDMIRQMEWRGNRLIWTGFYVGRPSVDTPNAQLKPPILRPDPVPVRYPRVQQMTNVTWSSVQNSYWEALPVFSWTSWGSYDDGVAVLPEAQRLTALQTSYWGW